MLNVDIKEENAFNIKKMERQGKEVLPDGGKPKKPVSSFLCVNTNEYQIPAFQVFLAVFPCFGFLTSL